MLEEQPIRHACYGLAFSVEEWVVTIRRVVDGRCNPRTPQSPSQDPELDNSGSGAFICSVEDMRSQSGVGNS